MIPCRWEEGVGIPRPQDQDKHHRGEININKSRKEGLGTGKRKGRRSLKAVGPLRREGGPHGRGELSRAEVGVSALNLIVGEERLILPPALELACMNET